MYQLKDFRSKFLRFLHTCHNQDIECLVKPVAGASKSVMGYKIFYSIIQQRI